MRRDHNEQTSFRASRLDANLIQKPRDPSATVQGANHQSVHGRYRAGQPYRLLLTLIEVRKVLPSRMDREPSRPGKHISDLNNPMPCRIVERVNERSVRQHSWRQQTFSGPRPDPELTDRVQRPIVGHFYHAAIHR
jgi:hypothetical protein